MVLQHKTRHILVKVSDAVTVDEAIEQVRSIKERLLEGYEFAALSKAHSADTVAKASGGDLGWTGLGQLVPEFEATMIALEVGQVSIPVKTDFGWHVIKLNEKRNQPVPELATVLEEIKQALTSAAIDKRISQLKESDNIVRNEQEIDPSFIKKFELFKD